MSTVAAKIAAKMNEHKPGTWLTFDEAGELVDFWYQGCGNAIPADPTPAKYALRTTSKRVSEARVRAMLPDSPGPFHWLTGSDSER